MKQYKKIAFWASIGVFAGTHIYFISQNTMVEHAILNLVATVALLWSTKFGKVFE